MSTNVYALHEKWFVQLVYSLVRPTFANLDIKEPMHTIQFVITNGIINTRLMQIAFITLLN